jgi:hypothetical protein
VNRVATDQASRKHPESDASQGAAQSFTEAHTHATYDAAGVDRSLIRWMLGLTPSERLRHVQGTIDLVRDVRRVQNGDR